MIDLNMSKFRSWENVDTIDIPLSAASTVFPHSIKIVFSEWIQYRGKVLIPSVG